MSFKPIDLGLPQLVGNVDVLRNSAPVLRASKRRSDPSGLISQPFYAGLASKKLTLEYTDPSEVVQSVTVTFPSSNYVDVLVAVNAADATNIAALDLDGFLAIQNKNVGKNHYLKIVAQSTPSDESAAILGFVVSPYPGSVSYAGEIVSAPGVRSQGNPQGTALIGKDEDLKASTYNRPLAVALQHLDKSRIAHDRERTVVESRSVTFLNNPVVAAADGITGGAQTTVANVFVIDDAALRIPTDFFISADPGGASLEELFNLLKDGSSIINPASGSGGRYRIRSVHYSTNATTANFRDNALKGSTFSVWGTPDDKSLFGSAVNLIQKTKHASVAISAIDGNRITCSGATFVTKKVQKGDTLIISGATLDVPFRHNGEYVVETVWDETNVTVRSKSEAEPLVFSTNNRPTELNPDGGFGNVSIPIGYFITGSHLVFVLERVGGSSWGLLASSPGTLSVLIKSGKSLRDIVVQTLARTLSPNPDSLVEYVDDHVTNGHHPAANIDWPYASPTFFGGEAVPGTNVREIISNIVGFLADNLEGASTTGSNRIGADTLTGSPTTLAGGTVKSQLLALLTALNVHINNGSVHVGPGTIYSGSPNWADGTSIPSGIQLDAAIDQVVSFLANVLPGQDGVKKIGAFPHASGNLGAGTTLRSQLDIIAANFARKDQANTWTQSQIFGSTIDAAGTITGSTLHALNDVIIDDDLTVSSSITITTGNLTTSGGDVHTGTLFGNAVSVSGDVRYGTTRTRVTNCGFGSNPTVSGNQWERTGLSPSMQCGGGTPPLFVQVDVEQGETITAWKLDATNLDTSADLLVSLISSVGGTTIDSFTFRANNLDGGSTTRTISHAIVADEFLLAVFVPQSSATAGTITANRVRVTAGRP